MVTLVQKPRWALRRELEQPRLKRILLIQIGLCVVPAMGLVGLGSGSMGAMWLFTVLFVLLARFLLLKDRVGFVSLSLAVLPAVMLLRSFFYYNTATAIMGAGVAFWFLVAPKEFNQIWKDAQWRGLLFIGAFYWLASYYVTGFYASNVRVLELVFSATSICLLSKHQRDFSTALLGVGLSAFTIGFGLLPFGGHRLGAVNVDGQGLGNPITFGIPLALIFLLCVAENGKWLLLEKHLIWRLVIASTSVGFLLLSTSRGSWAIVIVNIAVLMLNGKRQRRMLLLSVALFAVVTVLLLGTQRGPSIVAFYERTFGDDRTLAQRTSGRSDQWQVFPRVFRDSPLWGFGPGTGDITYGAYAIKDERDIGIRDNLQWHSLYLHVGAETGIIGLMALGFLLVPLLYRGFVYWRLHGNSVALIGTLGFMVIGTGVSAFDAVSGIFLGLGFLSIKRKTIRRFKWEHDISDPTLRILLRHRSPASAASTLN